MLEITIQRRVGGGWPVVAEHHRPETLLPVRSEGRLELDEPSNADARAYGRALGQALFRDAIRDAFVRARADQPGGVRVFLFVEADDLKAWRWEWLCAPGGGTAWDFLSLDQRVLYSLYLPSLTERAYPPIGRNSLRALVVVANPADPDRRYGLASFDANQNVARLQSIFRDRCPATVLARTAGTAGSPTLEEIETHLTGGAPDGYYTILHLVCHGWVNPHGAGETTLYLERPNSDPTSGQALAQPIEGTALIERLGRVSRLPYLVFLSTCESAAPEAEQRLGGLAQRLVRELGIPAVIGMTERVTVATAHALAEQFYSRLFAQTKSGEVDRALVQAYAGLVARPDVNVPALYSRLGERPLFSTALDRPLTADEIKTGLQKLGDLLLERAPVVLPSLAESAGHLQSTLTTGPEALSVKARQEREQALTRVNELCSEAVEISFHALAQGEQPPAYDARQPFRGLSPFRAGDREFFFGRDSLVEKLLQKLSAGNFLAVLGSSGSGKSSLVLAGLAPRLRTHIPNIQVIDDLTPGGAPMEQLKVRQSRLGFGPVLYIVDQFEELFTLCRDEGQRKAFIDELLMLAQRDRVVLTMRADFWGECARYPALKDRMLLRQELIATMTAGELRGAMEQQATKVGLRFEADLSNRMLDEVTGEPGAMPLLQHALLELWKRRRGRWLRAEEYNAIGRVRQAIAETADRLYNEASAADQVRIRDIFVRLTQIDQNAANSGGEGRRDTRRRLTLSDVLPAGGDPEEIKALIKRLADNVLIVTSRNELTGQEELEVSHEALIRHWGLLRKWLDDDLGDLRLRDSVGEAAKEWERNPDDESLLVHQGSRLVAIEELEKKARIPFTRREANYVAACKHKRERQGQKDRLIFKSALAAAVVFLMVAVFAGIQYQRADAQRTAAQVALWLSKAQNSFSAQKFSEAADYARRSYALAPTVENRSALLSALLEVSPHLVWIKEVRPDVTEALGWLDDTTLVVTSKSGRTETFAPLANKKQVQASWSLRRPQRPERVDPPSSLTLQTNKSGQTAVVFDDDSIALMEQGKERAFHSPEEHVSLYPTPHAVAIDSQAKLFATARLDDDAIMLQRCDWASARPCKSNLLQSARGRAVAISPDGLQIAVGDKAGGITLFDSTTGDPVKTLPSLGSSIEALNWAQRRNWIAAGTGAGDVVVINTGSPQSVVARKQFGGRVPVLAWSPTEPKLAFICRSTAICLWSPTNDQKVEHDVEPVEWYVGHANDITRIAWSPNGKHIASASTDGSIRVWALLPNMDVNYSLTAPAQLTSVAVDSTGKRLAAGAKDGTIYWWVLPYAYSGLLKSTTGSMIHALTWSRNGRIAALHEDDTVAVTSTDKGATPITRKHASVGRRLAWLDDGKFVAVPLQDGRIVFLDVNPGSSADFYIGAGGTGTADGIAINPANQSLFVSYLDREVMWDLKSASRQPKPFEQDHPNRNISGGSLSVSPDDRWLSASGAQGSVSIYDIVKQKLQSKLTTESRDTIALSFSPNGKQLAAIGGDSRLYVWTFVDGAATPFLILNDVRKADNLIRDQSEPSQQADWLAWVSDESLAVSTGSNAVAIICLKPDRWEKRMDSVLSK
jgi:WD40 repeat protein